MLFGRHVAACSPGRVHRAMSPKHKLPSGSEWLHEIKQMAFRSSPGRAAPNDGETVFRHACKLGLEGIVSKRLGSPYVSGRSRHWIKSKNPTAPAVKRETEEDWGKERWR
jgi:hypothetical protein